jgi:hypothetical protein
MKQTKLSSASRIALESVELLLIKIHKLMVPIVHVYCRSDMHDRTYEYLP